MSKRKMLFAVLVLLILFVGWIAWDTSPAMEKHNIPKAENLELRILYPEKPSAKVSYGPVITEVFRDLSANYTYHPYTVVGNLSALITPDLVKIKWSFLIMNRSQENTTIYILSPNFGNLSLVIKDQPVNLSKLSHYSLPYYEAKILFLNVSYPKDKPIQGVIEYETRTNLLLAYLLPLSRQFLGGFYFPQNYPHVIYFSQNFVFPISPVGILGLYSNGTLLVTFHSKYEVRSEYPLKVEYVNDKTTLRLDISKLRGSVYIYERGFFQEAEFTMNNTKVKVYAPKNTMLGFRELSNVTMEMIKSYTELLKIVPYSEINVIFYPDLPYGNGEEFEDFEERGVAIVGIQGSVGVADFLSTLGHEVAHVWFGSYTHLGRIEESLATYSQHLFALQFYEKHPEELKKYNMTLSEALDHTEEIIIAYNRDYTKPLARVYIEGILDSRVRNAIQYKKGAFVFRSLQFVLGNETFFEGLRELLKECHSRECNLTDVQNVFEKVSGQDLDWFFKEWFYTPKVPDYEVRDLTIAQADGYLLTFEIVDKSNFTMPVEVEVVTPAERCIKRIWVNGTAKISFELKDKPTKIILDPNEWMVNENKKYNIEGIEIIVE